MITYVVARPRLAGALVAGAVALTITLVGLVLAMLRVVLGPSTAGAGGFAPGDLVAFLGMGAAAAGVAVAALAMLFGAILAPATLRSKREAALAAVALAVAIPILPAIGLIGLTVVLGVVQGQTPCVALSSATCAPLPAGLVAALGSVIGAIPGVIVFSTLIMVLILGPAAVLVAPAWAWTMRILGHPDASRRAHVILPTAAASAALVLGVVLVGTAMAWQAANGPTFPVLISPAPTSAEEASLPPGTFPDRTQSVKDVPDDLLPPRARLVIDRPYVGNGLHQVTFASAASIDELLASYRAVFAKRGITATVSTLSGNTQIDAPPYIVQLTDEQQENGREIVLWIPAAGTSPSP